MSAENIQNFIEAIYKTKLVNDSLGNSYQLNSQITFDEGNYLSSIIRENQNISKTLEIGCAYGLSSLFICKELIDRPNASHTIIDCYQTEYWKGVGINNLVRNNIKFFEFIEKRSEYALPEICQNRGEGIYDLVFVDGWHTFDHVLVDSFYATKLLKVGGILILDDLLLPSVSKFAYYLQKYPCYEYLSCFVWPKQRNFLNKTIKQLFSLNTDLVEKTFTSSFIKRAQRDGDINILALRKIDEDRRHWDWFREF